MKKMILAAVAATGAFAAEGETPMWVRNSAISPDGQTVAFTYKGDVYAVDSKGGKARQLTSSSAYDSYPVWSPDGRTIVFASDRLGSLDLFAIDAGGGTPRRLTTNSGSEIPRAFLNDTTVLFSANVLPLATASQPGIFQQVYAVNINGGRPVTFASVPMGAISVGKGGRILYQDKKGYEDPLRKHERSSGTSDIWLIDGDSYTKLTDFDGHDLNPVWAGENKYYYVSEKDGTLNVYLRGLDGSETQLTAYTRHPVRSLSASDNGVLAYSQDGQIFTMQPGGEPRLLEVEIAVDDYDRDMVNGYRYSGATNMAVSPTGEEVAFVLRGDVYVTSVKYDTTKRITNTDGQERCISFSPDGKQLVYDSERDGLWQIFVAKIGDNDETFVYATDVTEELLYKGEKAVQQPEFSPDGKKVAFLEDRTALKVIDLKSKETTTALDGKYNYSYSDGDVAFEWSPDSRWFLASYIGTGGWNNTDVALVKADGTEVVDLTESGYSDGAPRWVLGGRGLTYTSGRYGYRSHGSWGEEQDVLLMMLDGEAWDEFLMTEEEAELAAESKKKNEEKADEEKADKNTKKDKKGKKDKKDKGGDDKEDVKPLDFDLANRNYRTRRLTRSSSNLIDYYLSPKGDKLYYIATSPEGAPNLMEVDLKKGSTKTLVRGVGYGGIVPDKNGENLFLLTDGGMKKIALPSGEEKAISFTAPFSRHPSAERQYIFDHCVTQVSDKFYDENLHGVDWQGYAADYRRFLPYINNNYDFAELLSELLGELNASHTGARYRGGSGAMSIGQLGAFFDEGYDGDGLKVTEVISRGPLSPKSVGINAGDIIMTIDGDSVKAGCDYYPLLEGKAGKKVRLGVLKADGEKAYVTVKPTASVSNLLYHRWVEHNEHVVDSVSGGRVGYVHVEGMDSESFRRVYSKLLGKYRNCDAVVVDTRYNGGGWLHNDIALLLSGKEYVRYAPKGHYIGSDPFSQWTKPSVMLVSEANYSDAHGTPYVYKTLGIGDVVGAPVPGTMTAVWWETQIDPTIVFGIPQVTSLDCNGKPLENQQLNPDILIYNNPLDEQRGTDAQLIGAVNSLLKKL